jgi:hypothetical protein
MGYEQDSDIFRVCFQSELSDPTKEADSSAGILDVCCRQRIYGQSVPVIDLGTHQEPEIFLMHFVGRKNIRR